MTSVLYLAYGHNIEVLSDAIRHTTGAAPIELWNAKFAFGNQREFGTILLHRCLYRLMTSSRAVARNLPLRSLRDGALLVDERDHRRE